MKLILHRCNLPLEHEFTTAHNSRTVQPTLIVELDHDGISGYGEATANSFYGYTIDSLVSDITRSREMIESNLYDSPDQLWHHLQPNLADNPFALCAIDAAAYDLFGKLQKQRTHSMLGLEWSHVVQSSYTIGLDSIDAMVAKIRQNPDWPVYKIKLGTNQDLDIVQRLRAETSAVFRIDANCGWTAAETITKSLELSRLGVEFIEQPLPASGSVADQKRVFTEACLPIIADESCQTPGDVEKCQGLFHGISVKLSKCGGLTPAIGMLKQARSLDMKTMVGCMVESTVGISAAAQLLPLLDYADLDGANLLATDVASGVSIIDGVPRLGTCYGSGVKLFSDTLLLPCGVRS